MSTTYAVRYEQGPGIALQGTTTRRISAAQWARAMAKPFVSHYWKRRTMRELSQLEDYRLEDIGVARADIPAIAQELARTHASAWVGLAAAGNGFRG